MDYNLILSEEYGPFTGLVGYVSAIVATAGGLRLLIFGAKGSLWETPQNLIAKQIRSLFAIILGIGIVFLSLNISITNIRMWTIWAIVLGAIAFVSFFLFFAIVRTTTYQIESVISTSSTKSEKIIGGFWLLDEARDFMKAHGILSVQKLLAGRQYDQDSVWSRPSQECARTSVVLLFTLIVFSGTLGLTIAGFILQVTLSSKIPS